MFENILFGPICISYLPKERQDHLKQIARNGMFPIVELCKGRLFDEVKIALSKKDGKLMSVILCVGYKKIILE